MIDHHAAQGAGIAEAKRLHRIEEKIVTDELQQAGFEIVARSDALSHPEDQRTIMVGNPSIRGKTDRFVILFRKPVSQ